MKNRSEAGQTMAEYAVVLSVITVGIVIVLALLSSAIASAINHISHVM